MVSGDGDVSVALPVLFQLPPAPCLWSYWHDRVCVWMCFLELPLPLNAVPLVRAVS